MLLRSLFNGVPIYPTIDGSEYEHIMGRGDPVVWTGRVGTYDPKEPQAYYEVYAPIQETSGWVWDQNLEPMEG